uniref:Uncharacterized protein n=1 Tax=Chromera velia CCMP2878 TaxID=1169474 RepID=A0A0G4HWE9_9ALVE|eukprot:Cvel_1441.t1-p1 / transcript=Cvel_1441.t1 / gene=Cvel_1441 / organism=Chromera_velia_CCMP2878 / gene_product=Protein NLRC3, putative / transcript_product=Protein NLRC3, putative / location=Cvel_scaffold50:100449-105556(-) / protein_length=1190 / sequence_SO=supercontig / SO=protein_coding / is_pseudo=false
MAVYAHEHSFGGGAPLKPEPTIYNRLINPQALAAHLQSLDRARDTQQKDSGPSAGSGSGSVSDSHRKSPPCMASMEEDPFLLDAIRDFKEWPGGCFYSQADLGSRWKGKSVQEVAGAVYVVEGGDGEREILRLIKILLGGGEKANPSPADVQPIIYWPVVCGVQGESLWTVSSEVERVESEMGEIDQNLQSFRGIKELVQSDSVAFADAESLVRLCQKGETRSVGDLVTLSAGGVGGRRGVGGVQWKPGRLLRRQEMKTDFFVPKEEIVGKLGEPKGGKDPLAFIQSQKVALFALSYPWLQKMHPDSEKGFHLQRVAAFFERLLSSSSLKGKRLALFWDFVSMWQSPRSVLQTVLFRRALSNMHILYAHQYVTVLRSTGVPGPDEAMNQIPYGSRGWPFFEACVSSMKDSRLILSLPRQGYEGKPWIDLLPKYGQTDTGFLSVPTGSHEFGQQMEGKRLTNGKDKEIVKKSFDTFFRENARQLEKIAVLNRPTMGDEHASMMADFVLGVSGLAGVCRLKTVELKGVSVGDSGLLDLAHSLRILFRQKGVRVSLCVSDCPPVSPVSLRACLDAALGGEVRVELSDELAKQAARSISTPLVLRFRSHFDTQTGGSSSKHPLTALSCEESKTGKPIPWFEWVGEMVIEVEGEVSGERMSALLQQLETDLRECPSLNNPKPYSVITRLCMSGHKDDLLAASPSALESLVSSDAWDRLGSFLSSLPWSEIFLPPVLIEEDLEAGKVEDKMRERGVQDTGVPSRNVGMFEKVKEALRKSSEQRQQESGLVWDLSSLTMVQIAALLNVRKHLDSQDVSLLNQFRRNVQKIKLRRHDQITETLLRFLCDIILLEGEEGEGDSEGGVSLSSLDLRDSKWKPEETAQCQAVLEELLLKIAEKKREQQKHNPSDSIAAVCLWIEMNDSTPESIRVPIYNAALDAALRLNNCSLTAETIDLQSLRSLFQKETDRIPIFQSLTLDKARLGRNEGAKILAQAIQEGKLASLQTLSLGGNPKGGNSTRMDDEGVKILVDAIRKEKSPNIQTLNLAYNNIRDEGAKTLAEAIGEGCLASLRALDLTMCEFGDEGAKAFAEVICDKKLASLQALSLGSKIGDEGAKALAAAIRQGSMASLQTLDLSSNDIGSEGAQALAEVVREGELVSLQTLKLKYNHAITRDKGATKALEEAIREANLPPSSLVL